MSMLETTTLSMPQPQMAAAPALRIFGATSYAFFSVASICANLLLAYVFVKGHRQFKRVAFFVIAWQMVVCDISMQAIQLIVAVPITYAGTPIYGETLWVYAPAFCDTIFYMASLYFSLLLTVNRVVVFVFPRANNFLFGRPNIYATVGFVWGVDILLVVMRNLIGCRKSFSSTGFYMNWQCPKNLSVTAEILKKGYTTTYAPVLMLIAYLLIFVYIRYSVPRLPPVRRNSLHFFERTADGSQESARRNREYGFLIQSFLICGMLEVQNLAFSFFPFLGLSGQWAYVVNFVQNWISILLNTISPIILFRFNEDVRRHVKQLFRREQKSSGVDPTVTYVANT